MQALLFSRLGCRGSKMSNHEDTGIKYYLSDVLILAFVSWP